MKIKYEFADGTSSEVEVSGDIGSVIIDSRKAEHAANERERYHREFSLDARNSEEDDWGRISSTEEVLLARYASYELRQKLQSLTPVQCRRLLCYAEGMTYREIALAEGVQIKAVQDSIEQARKKLKNLF